MPGTAIFDLDRTITRRPTWTRFCFFACRARVGFWLRVPLWMARGVALKLGLAERQAYKRYSLRLLSVYDRETLSAKAAAFAEYDVACGLRPGAVTAIERHKAAGDRLIMASACSHFLAAHYGRLLGFDDVIATDLAWEPVADRPPPPRLEGENCYGAEKLRRLHQLAAEKPFAPPVYAYSDHISDLEFLREADYGIAVNPSSGLRKAAGQFDIKIADFGVPKHFK